MFGNNFFPKETLLKQKKKKWIEIIKKTHKKLRKFSFFNHHNYSWMFAKGWMWMKDHLMLPNERHWIIFSVHEVEVGHVLLIFPYFPVGYSIQKWKINRKVAGRIQVQFNWFFEEAFVNLWHEFFGYQGCRVGFGNQDWCCRNGREESTGEGNGCDPTSVWEH